MKFPIDHVVNKTFTKFFFIHSTGTTHTQYRTWNPLVTIYCTYKSFFISLLNQMVCVPAIQPVTSMQPTAWLVGRDEKVFRRVSGIIILTRTYPFIGSMFYECHVLCVVEGRYICSFIHTWYEVIIFQTNWSPCYSNLPCQFFLFFFSKPLHKISPKNFYWG